MDYFFEPGFVYRDFACLQRFDFLRIIIHANDIMADVGEARARHKTDITRTNDCKIHK